MTLGAKVQLSNTRFFKAKHLLSLGLVLSVVLLLGGCKKSPNEYKFGGKTMGTTFSVTLYEIVDKDRLKQLEAGSVNELNKVNDAMSTWKKDSDLSKFNQFQANEFMQMPKEILYLIEVAKDISSKTDGKYDVTVGALVDLWGFGSKGTRNKPPTKQEIEDTLELVGVDKLVVDMHENKLMKKVAGLEVNLSSIAKGFAVDKVSDYLKSQGINNFIVEVGGELRASGTKAGGESWKIGIEKPLKDGKLEPQKIIDLNDLAIATSGNYKNYFKYGDKYYGHTIDPTTGLSATHNLLSTSVIHKDCTIADAWATALMASGEDKALEIAEKQGLIAYLMINTSEGIKIVYTKSFEEKFAQDDKTTKKETTKDEIVK